MVERPHVPRSVSRGKHGCLPLIGRADVRTSGKISGGRLLRLVEGGESRVRGLSLHSGESGSARQRVIGLRRRRTGLPAMCDELRHTAASLAIASGADVKVVQQMLGHSSATMTLDTYGHLFEDRLDEVGDAMDRARKAAQQRRNGLGALPRVAPVLPDPDSAGNGEAAPPSVSAGQDRFSDLYPRRDSNPRYRLERAAC